MTQLDTPLEEDDSPEAIVEWQPRHGPLIGRWDGPVVIVAEYTPPVQPDERLLPRASAPSFSRSGRSPLPLPPPPRFERRRRRLPEWAARPRRLTAPKRWRTRTIAPRALSSCRAPATASHSPRIRVPRALSTSSSRGRRTVHTRTSRRWRPVVVCCGPITGADGGCSFPFPSSTPRF